MGYRSCVFGCRATADDSVEHYSCCPLVKRAGVFSMGRLAIGRATQSAFVLAEQASDEVLQLNAMWIYGVFRTFHAMRNLIIRGDRSFSDGREMEFAFQIFKRHFDLACFGHTACRRVVASRWEPEARSGTGASSFVHAKRTAGSAGIRAPQEGRSRHRCLGGALS